MRKIATTDELTRTTCKYIDELTPGDYDENRAYGNILSDETYGKSQNWDNASSGYIPRNTVNKIKQFVRPDEPVVEGIARGIAEVTIYAFENFMNEDCESYEWIDSRDMIGVIKKIAGRFGRGAFAEYVFDQFVKESPDMVYKEPLSDDENNRVDTRTEDALYQVKLGGSLKDGTAGYRNDWKAPKDSAKINDETTEIVWITEEGCIMLKVDGRGMDGWEQLN